MKKARFVGAVALVAASATLALGGVASGSACPAQPASAAASAEGAGGQAAATGSAAAGQTAADGDAMIAAGTELAIEGAKTGDRLMVRNGRRMIRDGAMLKRAQQSGR